MPTPRKVYRIEEALQMAAEPQDDAFVADAPSVPADVIAELRAIRLLMQRRPDGAAGDPKNDAQSSETRQLKIELDVIGDAVKQTRCEIAAMQDRGFHASQIARVAKELDAAFHDATAAADRILTAAEDIDRKALALAACLNDGRYGHGHGVAKDIQDRVTAIYEACNFHDLTGQRFTKVAQTLKAIEDHLARIVEIWSVIDRFQVDAVPSDAGRPDSLLSGPKLNGDSGHSTQDEIDRHFLVVDRA
ncbi:protein phosphatase CheZ [Pseudorhodoplanes sp.]|uniref:protein phosphatase CheZ n=1 Tax=Pseudorhodoplanes sp. TaxID=1934341 RepID=UPI00391CC6CD